MKVSLSYHFYQKMPSHLFSRPFFQESYQSIVIRAGGVLCSQAFILLLCSHIAFVRVVFPVLKGTHHSCMSKGSDVRIFLTLLHITGCRD